MFNYTFHNIVILTLIVLLELVPVFASEQYDRHCFFRFTGLDDGDQFEELIESPETAGENYQRFGQVEKPEFSDEEVVKLESQFF